MKPGFIAFARSAFRRQRPLALAWLRVAALLLPVLCPFLTFGSSTIELSEYQKQEWQVEDGLPQSELRAVTQGRDGQLLIATYGGMAAFDGLNFTPLRADEKDPAASEPVNSLLVSRNGDLWIGTDDRGIIRQTAGASINVSELAGFSQQRIRGLFEDAQGTIWAATHDGIERITVHGGTQSVELLNQLGPISGDITTPFADDGHGGVLLLTSHGLFHLDARGTHTHRLQFHERHDPVKGDAVAIYRDQRGMLWVGLRDGLVRLTPTGRKAPGTPADEYIQSVVPGFHSEVTTLAGDFQGNLWVGTHDRGICRVIGSAYSCWSSKDGLADDYVRSLFEDDEHNLWVGLGSGGLTRWRIAPLMPLRDEPGDLRRAPAAAILEDQERTLWIGTWGNGLFRLKQGKITRQQLPRDTQAIRTMVADAHGNVWIGTWFNGLFRYDGVGFRHFLLGRESLTDAVSALVTDKQGGFWVGTYTGLLYFANGIPVRNGGDLLLPRQLITCLAEASDGSLLAGTSAGLYRVAHGKVSRVEGLSHPYVLSISIDSAGRVWVGTKGGGLDLLNGERVRHLGAPQGLVNYEILSVLDDHEGFLWMATSRGILRVASRQLEEVIHHNRTALDFVLLGRADGMPSSECVGVAQPSSIRRQDGSLWFATAKGLVHNDPRNAEIPPAPPSQIIRAVLNDAPIVPAGGLELVPGTSDLIVEFNAKNLGNPAQMEFRYKLDGYDRDWTITRYRAAHYRKLPPGRYRFLVNARYAGTAWPNRLAAMEVYQRPHFYQAWWFYAVLLVAAAIGAIRLFRWRVARAKGELGVVLEERNRIAREWHDTLMAGFAAISWQMETTARLINGDGRGSDSSPAAKACELARQMVKHCQTEARRILWDLRDNDEAKGSLSSALSNALKPLSAKEGVAMRLEVEGQEVALAPGSVHHLVCIGQEAVTNALRHALPNIISVRLQYQGDCLSLSVKDDGCGFRGSDKLASLHGHFGIPVMEERARKIGGSLRVESSAGQGTEVLVHLPFQMQLQGS